MLADIMDGILEEQFSGGVEVEGQFSGYDEIYNDGFSEAYAAALDELISTIDIDLDWEAFIQQPTYTNKSGQKFTVDVSSGGKVRFTLNGETYNANSFQTLHGRDKKGNVIGAFSGVTSMSDCDLISVLGHSDYVFYEKHYGKILEQAVLLESLGGLLDYKNTLYDPILNINLDQLIEIDGTVYNANEAGNFLWAMVLTYAGVFVDPNLIAQWGTLWDQNKDDEAWEQLAISNGEEMADRLGSLNCEAYDRLNQRIYFKSHYED